jgi:hypothetical protein
MRAARAAMAVAAIVAANTPAAAQPGWAAGSADLMKVCIASLLAPEELPAVLQERGMADAGPMHLPPGWDGTVYSGNDGKNQRGVTVGYQRYSDLRITNCTIVTAMTASYEDLVGLRALLEADRHIGKLEGRILTATPNVRLATFKRPGNAPIVTFNFTTSATTTSLIMSRLDLQPES